MNDRRDNEFMIVVPMMIGVSIVAYLTYSICSHAFAGLRSLATRLVNSCRQSSHASHRGDVYQIGSTHSSDSTERKQNGNHSINANSIYTIE